MNKEQQTKQKTDHCPHRQRHKHDRNTICVMFVISVYCTSLCEHVPCSVCRSCLLIYCVSQREHARSVFVALGLLRVSVCWQKKTFSWFRLPFLSTLCLCLLTTICSVFCFMSLLRCERVSVRTCLSFCLSVSADYCLLLRTCFLFQ